MLSNFQVHSFSEFKNQQEAALKEEELQKLEWYVLNWVYTVYEHLSDEIC